MSVSLCNYRYSTALFVSAAEYWFKTAEAYRFCLWTCTFSAGYGSMLATKNINCQAAWRWRACMRRLYNWLSGGSLSQCSFPEHGVHNFRPNAARKGSTRRLGVIVTYSDIWVREAWLLKSSWHFSHIPLYCSQYPNFGFGMVLFCLIGLGWVFTVRNIVN